MSGYPEALDVSFVSRIGATYLQQSAARLDDCVDWRPQPSLWSLVRAVAARLPNLRYRSLEVDGHQLRFWDIGRTDQEAVVLLHGFAANKENWLALAGMLAPHYRLLVPDIPGFGESCFKSSARYCAETQASRLAQWLQQVGVSQAHWVGSSMGGAIGGVLAADYPTLVRTLTLMNAAGVAGTQQSAFEQALLRGENYLVPRSFLGVVRLFRLATCQRRGLWMSLLPPLMGGDFVQRAPVHERIFHDLLQSDVDPTEHLRRIRAPTLVMWGDRDNILHPSCAGIFQGMIPRARTQVFRNVGHLPMLETPLLTARHLRRFWSQHALSAAAVE